MRGGGEGGKGGGMGIGNGMWGGGIKTLRGKGGITMHRFKQGIFCSLSLCHLKPSCNI